MSRELRWRERKMAHGVVEERKEADKLYKTDFLKNQQKTTKNQHKKKSFPTCWIQRGRNTRWENNSLENACWAVSGILLSPGNAMYKNEFKIQILLRVFTLQGMSYHERRNHLRTDLTLSLGRHFKIVFLSVFDFCPVSPNSISKQKASYRFTCFQTRRF